MARQKKIRTTLDEQWVLILLKLYRSADAATLAGSFETPAEMALALDGATGKGLVEYEPSEEGPMMAVLTPLGLALAEEALLTWDTQAAATESQAVMGA